MSDKLPRIIGIGASAGGLEALEQLFGAIPNGTGMAYVVIQHLSPDFKSLMTELLSRRTKMDIRRVDTEDLIEADHVYLIPPKKLLEIRGNKIVTVDFDHNTSPPRAVDHFFQSLARAKGSNSVGVVLSGTGSDGTLGSAAIREAGGIIIAQDPETCKFDGMPSSVIRKGLAHETLSPDEIAQFILGLNGQNAADNTDNSNLLVEKKHIFYEILAELEDLEGIDFKYYRMTTLARRIERRMQAAKFATVEDYFEHFKNDPKERAELQAEFLIGVTRFFRDEEAFEALRNSVIPELILRNEGQPIRVWVVGCSTGEEAISLAILLHEATLVSAKPIDFKVFATDVERKAIELASIGKYSANQIADLPRSYKETYFTASSADIYEIKPLIRRNIIYSHHNLLKDPPFTKIDLLSCRNLLIYFQNSLQDRCLNLFHFALKPGGVLFLGRSEALGEIHSEFETLNAAQKIFKKRGVSAFSNLMQGMKMAQPSLHAFSSRSSAKNLLGSNANVLRESQIGRVYEQLLNTFVPPCLLMDDKDQLIHVFGSASQLLKIPAGKTTLDVMKLLPNEIALALRSASTLATSNNQEVVLESIEWLENDTKKSMTLRVKPLDLNNSRSPTTLMVLFDLTPPASSQAFGNNTEQATGNMASSLEANPEGSGMLRYHWNEKTQEHIQSLENHLKSTRENLQTAIEELETTNEELQSTNEELMSSNEELQSSNEELHSVNEELYTVNTEYQNKIDELSRANLDIDFLLKTSRIGVIFLKKDLRIRRFNENVKEMISLMPHDIGRPITDLRFNYANREIIDAVQAVSADGRSLQLEIACKRSTQLVTISHYTDYSVSTALSDSSGADSGTGIVLSFVDITQSKLSEMIIQKSNIQTQFNQQLLGELRKAAYIGLNSEKAASLELCYKKLNQVENMISLALERKPISKSLEYTDLVSCSEVFDKLAVVNPSFNLLRTKGKLPDLITHPDILEELFSVLLNNLIPMAERNGTEIVIEAESAHECWQFDFVFPDSRNVTFDLTSLFAPVQVSLAADHSSLARLHFGLGAARSYARLLSGNLDVVDASPGRPLIVRLELPGAATQVQARPTATI